jgi:mono/diheme cytochrome c family protein
MMMKRTVILAVMVFGALISGLALAQSDQAASGIPAEVQAVFKSYCVHCHTGSAPPKGLSLIPSKSAALLDAPSAENPELRIVDTKNPEASYMLKKIRRGDGIKGKPMPPPKALPAEKLQVLETWILGLKKGPAPI